MNVTILILAAETVAARMQRWFAEAGASVDVVGSVEHAHARLDGGGPDALVVDLAFVGDDLERLVASCDRAAVERLIAVDGVPQSVHYERAFAVDAVGVLGADGSAGDAQRLLSRVQARRDARAVKRGEVERWQVQSDELRRRCKQQAEKFQETQETFYLDLSRMMTIITNIMDGIVFVDRGGNVTLMNPVAEDLLGMKSFVAIGKPISALHGQRELLDALVSDHERVDVRDAKEVTHTVEVHHSEQDLLYIKCMTSRVLDYRGQPAGTLTVLRDITAEFKTDQLKNQYLSIVAHELRTPLTGIKTFATMMSKGTLGGLNERQERVCESIKEQSVRLEHQIDKLINLGNLESADYGQDREVGELQDLLTG
ncbi:MAG: PAS domain-containing protein, partial [Planctomycetes bacterium]|nr:PAS domain-containing protein [Planctomycetota bacterium]